MKNPEQDTHASPPATADRLALLEARISALEGEVRALRATEEIKRLTRIYGYYLDKALWDEILPLFTDDCEVEISALGVYVGKRQLETLFKEFLGKGPARSGPQGLVHGQLYNHLMLQPVVHIEPSGDVAHGRWHSFMQLAQFGKYARWGEGVETFEYVRDASGAWRIHKMNFFRTFHTPYGEGWDTAISAKGGTREECPPDRPPSVDYDPWPGVYIPPFHYPNPITGEPFCAVEPQRA